jgi:hypothetical protein
MSVSIIRESLLTPDGRPIQMPQSFEKGVFLYVAGAGDHPTNGRGEGTKFRAERNAVGDAEVEWQFNDWVKIVGGTGSCVGGKLGDELSFSSYAPATQIEAVTPGQGSAVLVPTGLDFNVIVPYPGGTHNVVADSEVPVPASIGEQSFWSWSCPDTGKGTITATANGGYNLYDAIIPLSRHAPYLQLIEDRDLDVEAPNVEPLIFLPHWIMKVILHNESGDHTVQVVWEIKVVRKKTTKEW